MNVARAIMLTPAFVLTALIACSDTAAPPPPLPVPGELTIMLETPTADDRAILIRVTGPEMSGMVLANAAHVFHTRSNSTEFKSAVFGSLANGPLLRFAVPDVNRIDKYAATIIEVGDSTNVLRGSLNGYRVTIAQP